MNLIKLVKNLFKKSDFLDGSSIENRILGYTLLKDTLDINPDLLDFNDEEYLVLTEKQMERFTNKYHDSKALRYNSNSDTFPDCDDFVIFAIRDVVAGAVKEGFKKAPLFGYFCYKAVGHEFAHVRCFAVVKPENGLMKLRMYEPQNKEWMEMPQKEYFEYFDRTWF